MAMNDTQIPDVPEIRGLSTQEAEERIRSGWKKSRKM